MVDAIVKDPRSAPFDARRNALVQYAVRLTESPFQVSDRDLQALREAGLSEQAIHDAAAITAYFNFVNRIASGLGVELE